MKIGVTYVLYRVIITNSQGKTRTLLLNKDNLDYLSKISHPCYHIVVFKVGECAFVERDLDKDHIEDIFIESNWL